MSAWRTSFCWPYSPLPMVFALSTTLFPKFEFRPLKCIKSRRPTFARSTLELTKKTRLFKKFCSSRKISLIHWPLTQVASTGNIREQCLAFFSHKNGWFSALLSLFFNFRTYMEQSVGKLRKAYLQFSIVVCFTTWGRFQSFAIFGQKFEQNYALGNLPAKFWV